jgi:hypothetical protein
MVYLDYFMKWIKIFKKIKGIFPISSRDFSLASIRDESNDEFKYFLYQSCDN